LIIDPNGDFRRLSTPNSAIWPKLDQTFAALHGLNEKIHCSSFDKHELFSAGWKRRRFAYLVPGLAESIDQSNEVHRKLIIHWDSLDDDLQRFLLQGGDSLETKVALGIETVVKSARWMEANRPWTGFGYDLRGLQNMAEQYAARNEGLREYENAKILNADDWYSVRAKVSDVLNSYTIWWSRVNNSAPRPVGLTQFIDGAYDSDPTHDTYWDALVLALDSANQTDTLLAVEVTLARLWHKAKLAWRARADSPNPAAAGDDKRVPTFIVVDEAHNFAPEHTSNPLRERVTARLMQIASEGRKYGLYLILATQRPTKLHKELVPECENSCLLRVQSDRELEFSKNVLGFSGNIENVKQFMQGQGLFNGRWIDHPIQIDTKVATARTVVGGGGLSSNWKSEPDETPTIAASLATSLNQVATYVEAALKGSKTPIALASLAEMTNDKFDILSEGAWLGRENFKAMLIEAGIPELGFLLSPPGYAYLRGIHATDNLPKFGASIDMAQVPAELRELIERGHIELGMPILTEPQYAFVLNSTSKIVQMTTFDLASVSKAIRDDSLSQNMGIGRNAINFILKALMIAGHRFDLDLPQSPSVLAEAFCSSILEGLRRKGYEIDPTIMDRFKSYLSGGIIRSVVPEANAPALLLPATAVDPIS